MLGRTRRDAPSLGPAFYRQCLIEAGQPDTQQNVLAIARFTNCIIGAHAYLWFASAGDEAVRERWQRRFGTPPANSIELLRRADEAIGFLWAWTPRAHGDVRDLPSVLRADAVKVARKYGPHLPMNIWEINE